MPKVYYIGFFDTEFNIEEDRNYVLSATNKMRYIADSINKLNTDVEFISCSASKNNRSCRKKRYKINENQFVQLFFSFKATSKILRFINRFLIKFQMKKYIRKNIKKDDTIIVYHSLAIMKLYSTFKKYTDNFIIEVEEIYSDVLNNKKLRKKELKKLSIADKYLFATELLNDLVNVNNKKYAVCYGRYKVEKKFDKKWNDNKIHCVYSGTFDPRKGGCLAAINAAKYLNQSYFVHILGRGSDNEISTINNMINNINKEKGYKIVCYDGYKSGDEYNEYLQKCQIGLSTQIPDGVYNDTSFPSKILSYMCNGLNVVAINIKAVNKSAINSYVNFYYEHKPELIAAAIVDAKIYDRSEILKKIKYLDEKFIEQMKNIL